MTHSKNSPPPPTDGAPSGREADEAPAKKPWSRPTFYVLTDVIESHGNPGNKVSQFTGLGIEDETIPNAPGSSRQKEYRPTTA